MPSEPLPWAMPQALLPRACVVMIHFKMWIRDLFYPLPANIPRPVLIYDIILCMTLCSPRLPRARAPHTNTPVDPIGEDLLAGRGTII